MGQPGDSQYLVNFEAATRIKVVHVRQMRHGVDGGRGDTEEVVALSDFGLDNDKDFLARK